MSEEKGKGFFSGIAKSIRDEVMDSGPDMGEPLDASAPNTPIPLQTIPIPSAMPAPGSTPVAAEPVDPEALKQVQAKVFGVATHLTPFQKMREALGNPADLNVVFRALQVTEPGLTPAVMAQDIDTHLQLLAEYERQSIQDLDAEAKSRLGTRDTEIADLTQKNTDAAAEIARHTRESTQRSDRIKTLQAEKSEEEAKIQRGRNRSAGAAQVVRTQLETLKRSFGTQA